MTPTQWIISHSSKNHDGAIISGTIGPFTSREMAEEALLVLCARPLLVSAAIGESVGTVDGIESVTG